MDDLQAARIEGLLTEIRDELRNFVRILQEPGPATEHVHTPKDGSSPLAPFWVCACGHIHDDEQEGT